ncbi:nectin-1-like isoform X2 [Spea bombifrons]|uniref:nectin-1-like isoform X2 n=1 Tax=Spea bombifrons TaxID=233779 RepID=UPI00234A4B74|nr:nectin-1-like isoform X2 [Spea bombifrons]
MVLWLLHAACIQSTGNRVIVNGPVYAELGASALMGCKVQTEEIITQVTWQKKTSTQNEDFLTYAKSYSVVKMTGLGQRVKYLGNDKVGDITISNLTLADEGTYRCVFTLHPSGVTSQEIKLIIQVSPEVYVEPSAEPVVAGCLPKTMGLCIVKATKPAANITWNVGSFQYHTEENTTLHDNGTVTTTSQLKIPPSRELFGYNVSCLVFWPNDEAMKQNTTFTIKNIYYGPSKVEAELTPTANGDLQLSCESDSNPPASNFTWTKGDAASSEFLARSKVLTLSSDASSGLYVCEATNPLDSKLGYVYIYKEKGSNRYVAFVGLFIVSLIVNIVVIWKMFMDRRKRGQEMYQAGKIQARPTAEEELESRELQACSEN